MTRFLKMIVMAFAGWIPSHAISDDAQPMGRRAVCVVLIGGIDSDPSPAQIAGTAARGQGQSGMYQLAADLNQAGIYAEYFNWNGSRAGKFHDHPLKSRGIAEYLRDRQTRVPEQLIIIGNSWGGHTAWEVCESLEEFRVPVDLVIFLDPASTGRSKSPRPHRLPESVKAARNYYTRNLFGWREWPGEKRLKNIDLGDPVHGYLKPGGPQYDSTFDPQAHIAAEWDPRIHLDFQRQIQGVGAVVADAADPSQRVR